MSAPASPRHPAIRPSFLFILIACLLALVARAQAQIPSLDEVGGGTRFIVAFPDTVGNLLDPRFPNTLVSSRFDICIYSGVAENPVRITRGNGSRSTVTPLPGRFSVVQVSPDPAITTLGVVDANTITVESLYPVVIYCVALTSQGMDAWTPLPVERWGTSYAVASLPGDRVVDIGMSLAMGQPAKKRPAPAEIVAIAAHNATHVTIVAGRGQRFADGSSSLHALLNAGQCIQVQSYVDTSADFEGDQADMAGVQVTADHPIGVISGNTRSLVWPSGEGLLMNAYKNAGLEWLAPTDEHGREFVYMPSWDSHRPGLGSPA